MKKIFLIFTFLFLIIITACNVSNADKYTDCGSDKNCVVKALLKGEKAQATITETEQQDNFKTVVKYLMRSEGEKNGKVVLYREVLQLTLPTAEIPELPETASELEKQQYEESKLYLQSFLDKFKKIENTSATCTLDPAKVEALGIDKAFREVMQASIDPESFKVLPDGDCKGSLVEAYASIMSELIQIISQALAQQATTQGDLSKAE